MTLCFSRHQYVELVRDQTVATWRACHRRAFEWFGGVPARIILNNAKCAIIRACLHEPVVQRAYFALVGSGLWLRATPTAVALYAGHELAACGSSAPGRARP